MKKFPSFNEDPRIKDLIGKDLSKNKLPKIVILGFPSDEGVLRNGGRPGASKAPDEIRKALYKMTPDARSPEKFSDLIQQTEDTGNISVTNNLETDQEKLGDEVARYFQQGIIPVILGGGHGTAFGHFQGYAQVDLNVSIFNLDAHADVRPLKEGKAHSGSPFRQALEHESGCCRRYSVAGLQPHSVAESHLQFISEHGGEYVFREETNFSMLEEWFRGQESGRLMVTLDMDSVDQAFAPGVSAPCTNGVSSELFIHVAFLAGKCRQVTSFDVSEVNPRYDRDEQTTKLAALAAWNFLAGACRR